MATNPTSTSTSSAHSPQRQRQASSVAQHANDKSPSPAAASSQKRLPRAFFTRVRERNLIDLLRACHLSNRHEEHNAATATATAGIIGSSTPFDEAAFTAIPANLLTLSDEEGEVSSSTRSSQRKEKRTTTMTSRYTTESSLLTDLLSATKRAQQILQHDVLLLDTHLAGRRARHWRDLGPESPLQLAHLYRVLLTQWLQLLEQCAAIVAEHCRQAKEKSSANTRRTGGAHNKSKNSPPLTPIVTTPSSCVLLSSQTTLLSQVLEEQEECNNGDDDARYSSTAEAYLISNAKVEAFCVTVLDATLRKIHTHEEYLTDAANNLLQTQFQTVAAGLAGEEHESSLGAEHSAPSAAWNYGTTVFNSPQHQQQQSRLGGESNSNKQRAVTALVRQLHDAFSPIGNGINAFAAAVVAFAKVREQQDDVDRVDLREFESCQFEDGSDDEIAKLPDFVEYICEKLKAQQQEHEEQQQQQHQRQQEIHHQDSQRQQQQQQEHAHLLQHQQQHHQQQAAAGTLTSSTHNLNAAISSSLKPLAPPPASSAAMAPPAAAMPAQSLIVSDRLFIGAVEDELFSKPGLYGAVLRHMERNVSLRNQLQCTTTTHHRHEQQEDTEDSQPPPQIVDIAESIDGVCEEWKVLSQVEFHIPPEFIVEARDPSNFLHGGEEDDDDECCRTVKKKIAELRSTVPLVPFHQSISVLKTITLYQTPTRKLAVIKAASLELLREMDVKRRINALEKYLRRLKRATAAPRQQQQPQPPSFDPLGGDDFLPMFVYVLVQARVPKLLVELEFVRSLLQDALRCGEEGYYATTLELGVEFVKGQVESRLQQEAEAAASEKKKRRGQQEEEEDAAAVLVLSPPASPLRGGGSSSNQQENEADETATTTIKVKAEEFVAFADPLQALQFARTHNSNDTKKKNSFSKLGLFAYHPPHDGGGDGAGSLEPIHQLEDLLGRRFERQSSEREFQFLVTLPYHLVGLEESAAASSSASCSSFCCAFKPWKLLPTTRNDGGEKGWRGFPLTVVRIDYYALQNATKKEGSHESQLRQRQVQQQAQLIDRLYVNPRHPGTSALRIPCHATKTQTGEEQSAAATTSEKTAHLLVVSDLEIYGTFATKENAKKEKEEGCSSTPALLTDALSAIEEKMHHIDCANFIPLRNSVACVLCGGSNQTPSSFPLCRLLARAAQHVTMHVATQGLLSSALFDEAKTSTSSSSGARIRTPVADLFTSILLSEVSEAKRAGCAEDDESALVWCEKVLSKLKTVTAEKYKQFPKSSVGKQGTSVGVAKMKVLLTMKRFRKQLAASVKAAAQEEGGEEKVTSAAFVGADQEEEEDETTDEDNDNAEPATHQRNSSSYCVQASFLRSQSAQSESNATTRSGTTGHSDASLTFTEVRTIAALAASIVNASHPQLCLVDRPKDLHRRFCMLSNLIFCVQLKLLTQQRLTTSTIHASTTSAGSAANLFADSALFSRNDNTLWWDDESAKTTATDPQRALPNCVWSGLWTRALSEWWREKLRKLHPNATDLYSASTTQPATTPFYDELELEIPNLSHGGKRHQQQQQQQQRVVGSAGTGRSYSSSSMCSGSGAGDGSSELKESNAELRRAIEMLLFHTQS